MRIFGNGSHKIVGQAVFAGIMKKAAVLKGENSARASADPENPAPIYKQATDDFISQAFFASEICELPIFITCDTRAESADPQVVFMIYSERKHIIVFYRRILGAKNVEADTIEPDKSRLSAQPQIAITRLSDREDTILRQPVLIGPEAMPVFVDRGSGI